MKWLSFITICIVLFSCNKETIEFETQKIELGVDYNVRDLVFINDTLVYACGGNLWDGGFIARSEDAGVNWQIVYNHTNIVFKIAFLDEKHIAAGAFWGGLLTSADYGVNWQYVEHPDYSAVNDLHFLNDTTLFFTTGESYHFGGTVFYDYITGDYEFNNLEKSVNSLYFFDENNGVFGAYGLIYTTSNGGKTLEPTNVGGDFFVDLDFNNEGKGVAVGYQGKIFSTKNQGNSWEKTAAKSHFFTSKGNLECVAVNQNKAFIGGQDGTFFYTDDFTKDWIKVEHPYESYDIYNIVLKDNFTGYAMGSNGLLFKFNY